MLVKRFYPILLATLAACVLGNMLAGKGVLGPGGG